jgi:uncharacterized membrane protein
MNDGAHLWAIGYDDMDRAEQVRAEATRLGEKHSLILLNTAVAIRYADGLVTLNGEPVVSIPYFRGHSFAGFLTGLALGAPPLTGSVAGALARAGDGPAAEVGIGEDFIQEVQALMKPGTSALFILDEAGDMPAILRDIRGLGGTVLRTNVDVEHANLIQSTLAAGDDKKEERA